MTIINQKSISGITSITFASAGDDLLTFHSNNGTERFRIDNSGNTKITAGIVTALTITGTTTLNGNLDLQDNDKILIGTGDDFAITHDGSNTTLINDTGQIQIRNRADDSDILLQTDDGSGGVASYILCDGSTGQVDLFHYGTRKLNTTSDGITVSGNVTADGLSLGDSEYAYFGASNDLQIYHNGTNSLVDNATGTLAIRNLADDQDVNLQTDDGSGGVTTYVRCDGSIGSVRLYHYGTEKAYTKSDGFDVVGELQCDSLDVDGDINLDGGATTFSASANTLDFADSVKANFGNGDDLQIYHDGTHSYINDGGTGNLKVLTTSMVVKNAADSEIMLQATQNGSVDLYYDNSKKFETLTNGVRAQGGILFGSDTANANALDDYEEGTWTLDNNGDSTGIIASSVCKYTKVGRLVTCHFVITVSNAFTSNSLSGLPFNPANGSGAASSVHNLIPVRTSGGTYFFQINSGNDSMSVLSNSSGTATTLNNSNGPYRGTFTYQTA